MSRKSTILLWLCLHCLLPCQTKAQTLEYWFDDLYDQHNTTDIATSNAEQDIELDLRDNMKFPKGFHQLNMRVILNGEPSAVYSSLVLKLSAGKANRLEYWLDDDIAHSQTIEGKPSSDGSLYQFLTDLDFSGATPGYHRLYCRAVSNSKQTSGAISMTPIMVKSKYNVSDTEKITVTDQIYWIDNEDPKHLSVVKPSNEISQPYNLDVRKLSDGQHTLHFQFGNSAGIWSSPVDFIFNKTKTGSYQIVAEATEENGIVTIKYATVPYGQRYAVYRQYPSGTKRKINDIKATNYPADLQAIDTPAPGTYTYYVEGIYTDPDGVNQKVRSGEIQVTVEQKANTVPYGRIFGLVTFDGQRYWGNYPTNYVYINGVNALKSGFGFRPSTQGEFCIEYIPYGTEITIGIEQENYVFQEKKVIMDENTDDQHFKFNGIKLEDIEEQPSNDSYDLELASNIHLTPEAWELKVWNDSKVPWSGDIIVKVISKKDKDKYDKQQNSDDTSFWGRISNKFSSKGSEEDEILLKATTKTHIRVEGKKYSDPLYLDITEMPEKNKKEEYYVYVYSLKDGTDNEKELSGRIYGNPQVLEFNPFDIGVADEKGFVDYIHCYQELLKHFKELAKWGDPFEKEFKDLSDYAFDMWIKSLDQANKEDDPELVEDIIKATEKSTGFVLNCFCSDLRKEMKKVKGNSIYDAMKNLDDLYKTIKGFHDANQLDDNRKFFANANQVLKIYKKLKIKDYYGNSVPDPIINLYATYFEVGEAFAEAAGRIANHYSKFYVWQRLSEGNGIYKIKIRKYRTDKGVEYFRGQDFSPKPGYTTPHNGQIESIKIELIDYTRKDCKLPVYVVDWEKDDDGITIKNVVFNSGNNNQNYWDVEAWMTITWKNKRVTRVPLLDEDFVKLENLNKDVSVPLIMTVELQSDTYMNLDKIPNRLHFVKPK